MRIEDILDTAPTDTIIIKADIEGFECKVWEHATALLSRQTPKVKRAKKIIIRPGIAGRQCKTGFCM